MADILEYYLAGGNVRIGKKELALELLRKDSILRALFGFEAGIKSLHSAVNLSEQGDFAMIEFNWREKRKLAHDPTAMLNELKKRYEQGIGGILRFHCFYPTLEWTYQFDADLDAENVVLVQIG